jgi:hypothetical protein
MQPVSVLYIAIERSEGRDNELTSHFSFGVLAFGISTSFTNVDEKKYH